MLQFVSYPHDWKSLFYNEGKEMLVRERGEQG